MAGGNQYIVLSWARVEHLIRQIAEWLRGISPERFPMAIVAVGRGGLVAARLLSDILGIQDIRVISTTSYRKGTPIKGGLRMHLMATTPLGGLLGKPFIVVDDIVDEGTTMRMVQGYLFEFGLHHVGYTSAALVSKDKKQVAGVDFAPLHMPPGIWAIFPWDVYEFQEMKQKEIE